MRQRFPLPFKPIAIIIFLVTASLQGQGQEPVKLLILSGQNNHDWQKTTPMLERILTNSGMFTVSITNRPDTLEYSDYLKFRLIVSNWNSWPDTSNRWDPSREQAFEQYIREGGGAVFFHAGGSSFYGWNNYHSIAIGRWGPKTSHGQIGEALVNIANKKHPITKGLRDFTITDEIWENTDLCSSAKVLGTVRKINPDGSPGAPEYPAILVSRFGKGRTFYTSLGHDEHTLSFPELQKLLINAAAWVSKRDID